MNTASIRTASLLVCCALLPSGCGTTNPAPPVTPTAATPSGAARVQTAATPKPEAKVERSGAIDPLLRRWNASCPVAPILGGSCAKFVAPAPGTSRCAEGVDLIEVVRRRPDGAAAQREAARRLATTAGSSRQRSAWRLLRAEQRFEAFLALRMPAWRTTPQLKAGLLAYLRGKGKALNAARAAYQPLAKTAASPWDRAATLRLGLLYTVFGRELMLTAVPQPPTPATLTTAAAREEFRRAFTSAFCDTLQGKAAPLLKKGIAMFDRCGRWRPRQDAQYRACRRALKEARGLYGKATKRR
jgi:hypothetical protein